MKIPDWACGLAALRLHVDRSLLTRRLLKFKGFKFKGFKYWAIAALSALLLAVKAIATPAVELPCQSPIQLASQRTVQPGSQPVAIAQASLLGQFVQTLPSLLAVQFAPPFPQINGLARIARVPIVTYLDITATEFEADLQQIQAKGVTPISLDQLTRHLSTGIPLPSKPIVLTFDGGYLEHYQSVYPLLKEFGYPGVFAVYPGEITRSTKQSRLSWKQLQVMAADPLITIASHGLTSDQQAQPDESLQATIVESKRQLEKKLGIAVRYFAYPTGISTSDRVQTGLQKATYQAALTEPSFDAGDRFAGESANLLSLERMDQSQLAAAIEQANGGMPLPAFGQTDNFHTAIQIDRRTIDQIPLILVSGGRPVTIHADSRYQVPDIIAHTKIAQATAVAAVDGGYFSLEQLQSNVMIGPILSQNTHEFVPADAKENKRLTGRPLVLIDRDRVRFVPFNPDQHNTLAGIRQEMPQVTDAFVAAAWLVKNGQPQPLEAFGNLYKVYEPRDRAFWGMNYAGQPVIGVTSDLVDSISLGSALSKAGLRDVVMLDSGASTSLAYRGESMMSFEPRPVPHVVALLPLPAQPLQPQPEADRCSVVSRKD